MFNLSNLCFDEGKIDQGISYLQKSIEFGNITAMRDYARILQIDSPTDQGNMNVHINLNEIEMNF
jgi:hypothetical protein